MHCCACQDTLGQTGVLEKEQIRTLERKLTCLPTLSPFRSKMEPFLMRGACHVVTPPLVLSDPAMALNPRQSAWENLTLFPRAPLRSRESLGK